MLLQKGRRGQILFLPILLLMVSTRLLAQVKEDTTHFYEPDEKSPSVAVIRSALIPGWGQWYNRQRLKAIVVLGGELALVGNAIYYNKLAVRSSTWDEREFYRDVRSRFIWWFLGVYLLNLLDAYVDAHLWNFDTGPDLSLCGDLGREKYVWMTFCLEF